MKHKGFTLLEVVISLAIFAIIMGPVLELCLTTKKTLYVDNTRNTSMMYAKTTMETFKSMGKSAIINLQPTDNSFSRYFFFNDNSELTTILTNKSFINNDYAHFQTDSAAATKTYGAFISFNKSNNLGKEPGTSTDVSLESKYTNVKIDITIVKCKDSSRYTIPFTYYIGR